VRTLTHRPRGKIRNGAVAKRRRTHPLSSAPKRVARSRRSSAARGRRRREQRRGSRVLWMLIFIGAVLGTGFVLAMRSQINAYQLAQAEAQLRTELDEIANRQRFEILQQQRTLNPRASDRAARRAGLIQPSLKRQDNPKSTAQAVRRKKEGSISERRR
jgi:cell division protein FtsB